MAKKILIIRLSSLGDIILTSATVSNIALNQPDAQIYFLCKESYRDVAELLPDVDHVLTIPKKISLTAYIKFLIELDSHNFDLIFDLQGNIRSWWAKKILSANNKYTYPKRRLERMAAVKGKMPLHPAPHTIDLYNQTVSEAGMKVYNHRPLVKTSDNSVEHKQFFEQHNKVVVIAPGAAHQNKTWGMDNFSEVASNLIKAQNIGIIWAVTQNDDEAFEIQNKIDQTHLLRLVDTPIDKLSGYLSKADLTLANDSGIAHLASAVNCPVVAVFGPTHPVLGFAPRGMFDEIIEVDEYCRPCSLHGKKPCYREERFCFTRISPEIVSNFIRGRLSENLKTERAVFVDRDGTIIKDKHFLSDPDEVELIPGAVEALKKFQNDGFKIVIVSNQSGVARGYFDLDSVEIVNAHLCDLLASQHVLVDAVYYCPHHAQGVIPPYNITCNCRKPSAGMAETAAYQLGLDLRRSFVVGDKIDDMNLAKVIGAKGIMVKTGYGAKQSETIKNYDRYREIKIALNIQEAASFIKYDND